MPFDAANTTYETLLGNDELDLDWLEQHAEFLPGAYVDTVNKMLKPVPNYIGTPLRLFNQVQDGTADKSSYQPMAKWVADNPNFPMRAFRQWVTWVYRENRLARGRLRLRGEGGPVHDPTVHSRRNGHQGPHRPAQWNHADVGCPNQPRRGTPRWCRRTHRPDGRVSRHGPTSSPSTAWLEPRSQ